MEFSEEIVYEWQMFHCRDWLPNTSLMEFDGNVQQVMGISPTEVELIQGLSSGDLL